MVKDGWMMGAYYNEYDPFAAAWLRELIKDGLIADGEVDERSIEDVRPDELRGFAQCHFFAGIGVWSLALRQAGWADDRPIWTGSCPCQPFSAAGKGNGFADERHLWPHFHYLIEQCRPGVVVGEQVASKDGLGWLDLVQADLEGTGYASAAVDICAAGFGAPHIRQRLYWVAHAEREYGVKQQRPSMQWGWQGNPEQAGMGERNGWLADADGWNASAERQQCGGQQRQQPQDGGAMRLAHATSEGWRQAGCEATSYREADAGRQGNWDCNGGAHDQRSRMDEPSRSRPTNGYWRDADWLRCTDEKWRAVEPGTFPLADAGTVRNRVGLLRGAGNAITIGQAQGFIEAVMDVV